MKRPARTPRAGQSRAVPARARTPAARRAAAPRRAPVKRAFVSGADAQSSLLAAAEVLFYRQGARAVGVDAVVQKAGVNKMSLYRQFDSKDELIAAYAERMDRAFWARWEASVALHRDPAEQIVQLFRDWSTRASAPGYRGCPLVNVAIEFPDVRHPARRIVSRSKIQAAARFAALARAAGAADPARLAGALALLMEGLFAASQTLGEDVADRLTLAPALARQLVDASRAGAPRAVRSRGGAPPAGRAPGD